MVNNFAYDGRTDDGDDGDDDDTQRQWVAHRDRAKQVVIMVEFLCVEQVELKLKL